MIDIRRLRMSYDEVRANLARRHIDLAILERAVALDEQVRELSSSRDQLRAKVKLISKEVGEAHRNGDKSRAEELAAESRSLGDDERKLDEQAQATERELRDIMLVVPNEISASTPDGMTDAENPVIRPAEPREWADYQRVPHWEIGKELGILDPERAVRMSGSMFNMFRGAGATLTRALCQYALDSNADIWEEIRPPSLVHTHTLESTGHLPKFEDELYAIERDNLWTIPTAEVPLTSIARDEILELESLPMRMMAYTSCFRREAGAAGKDTRGLLRVHEFDKVEMMGYVAPDQAEEVMFDILDRSEKLYRSLGLQIRVIEICAGDLGRSHHRSFDVEAYAPGVDAWLEVASCSWFTDYQARRANVRYRTAEGKPEIVHTCNGSAVAIPRAWAAITETHRQADGSVRIPEVLLPYMRGLEIIESK